MTSNPDQVWLHELIAAVPNLSAPSNTRLDPLRQWMASTVALPAEDVYAVYVSKNGNFKVRLDQSGAQPRRLALALLGEAATIESCATTATKFAGPGRHFGCIALCTQLPHGWDIVAVVGSSDDLVRPELLAHFPEAKTYLPAGSPVAATRGPTTDVLALPLELDARIRRMVRLAIASSPAVMLVGPPGTGKTTLLESVVAEIQDGHEIYGFTSKPEQPMWVTPEESWSTRDLVGGETVDEKSRLRFRPGHVLHAIRQNRWLILDEANRADMDRIFGGLLTWLSDHEVELGRASTAVDAPRVELGWRKDAACAVVNIEALDEDPTSHQPGGVTAAAPLPEKPPVRFEAGREWRLLGTYNAVDAARVFRFGQALGRRFVRVPIPPMSVEEFETALTPQTEKLPGKVLVSLVALYKAHLSVEAALLGPGVFFRAVGYVRNGLALKGLAEIEDEGDGADEQMEGAPASQPAIDALIAEAYLLAAGAWLARLERAELDLLRAAIPTTVLDEDQWTWLTRLLRALA